MRILIIKTSSFGDIVQAFPVIHYIKSRFPDCTIDWIVEKQARSLVQAHPEVTRIIEIDSKGYKKNLWKISTYQEIISAISILREVEYDVVFDLQGNIKSSIILACTKSDYKVGFSWKSAPEKISCLFSTHKYMPDTKQNIRNQYLGLVASFFEERDFKMHNHVALKLSREERAELALLHDFFPANSWMICPGSVWKNKQLDPHMLKNFLLLLKQHYSPFFVLVAGSIEEKKIVEEISLGMSQSSQIILRPSPSVLQHIMRHMQVIISVDSFPLHLAATTPVPTWSVFGPSFGTIYAPIGENHGFYQGICPYGKRFEKRCPVLRSCPTGACMHSLHADELYSAFSKFWLALHPNIQTVAQSK